jgi:hypothetical protein
LAVSSTSHELALRVGRGNHIACCQFQKLITPGEKERVSDNKKRGDTLLGESGKGSVDIVLGPRLQEIDALLAPVCPLLHVVYVRLRIRIVRVREHRDRGGCRNKLPQQFQSLCH